MPEKNAQCQAETKEVAVGREAYGRDPLNITTAGILIQ